MPLSHFVKHWRCHSMGNVTWWVTLVCTMRSRSLACSHTMKGLYTWFLKHLGRKPACAWKRAWGRPWESFPATRNFRIPQMPQQHSCSLQKKKKIVTQISHQNFHPFLYEHLKGAENSPKTSVINVSLFATVCNSLHLSCSSFHISASQQVFRCRAAFQSDKSEPDPQD